MRTTVRIIVLAMLLLAANSASAQFWPGSYYGYGYGGWGGLSNQTDTLRQVTAENRVVGQQAAMQQNAAVQGGIRSTLMNQAQSQTNALMSKRQANQDWWFQYQGQQMAERRAQGNSGGGPATALEPGRGPASRDVATDIIAWPAALQDQAFAFERSQIEAPYRRHPPGVSTPTAQDYRKMAKTVEQMKSVLEWQLTQSGGLDTGEYNEAKAFSNKLGQEVTQQAGKAG